jgi:DNA methylase
MFQQYNLESQRRSAVKMHYAFLFSCDIVGETRLHKNYTRHIHSQKMPKRKNTVTSSFGSPGREGHDSSAFYQTRLYADRLTGEAEAYVENPIGDVDVIFHSSCEDMKELPDNSVHLMVTSPPYNVGKEYDNNLTLEEYLTFLMRVWKETYRVLVPGGRACINIANVGRKPYIPLHASTTQDMIEHVDDPELAIQKMASLLTEDGSLSFEVPNNDCITPVKSDGHF